MSKRARVVAGVVACVLALSLAGCGGGGNDVTTPQVTVPTPVPCTQTTIEQDGDTITARTLLYFDFSVPDNGRLDITIDWTYASSMIGVYVVPVNTCTLAEFNARTCNFLIRSETSVKPRKISTPNFTAGNYRWIIGNFSESLESVSIQILLSKGGCAALGVVPSASERADDVWSAIERSQRH